MAAMLILGLCGCGDDGESSSSPTIPTPTPTPTPTQTTSEFIAAAIAGSGTMTLRMQPDRLTFAGCLVKQKTSDRRVLGAAHFMTNESGAEYRLTKFSYILDTSGLQAGEAAESDIGFTILPKNEVVALNSGEETLITHQYDAQTGDRGIVPITLPAGGVSIPTGSRLSAASVTGIFPQAGGGAKEVSDDRLADGKFMRMCYSAELSRVDLISAAKVMSYRSPYRDRSYVADPSRTTAPFTNFKNTSSHSVRVYGVGTFISNLSDSEHSDHETNIYVNGVLKAKIALPSHVPGSTTPLFPPVHDVDVNLAPGDVLSVRGKVTPKRAIVFDYAAFIFADDGLTPIDERLNVIDVDLNGDGYNDIMDLDAQGSIWVSIRVGGGLQDTQQEWMRSLRNADALTALSRASTSDPLTIKATSSNGMCLNLRAQPQFARFVPDYCNNNIGASSGDDYWGDFNGDGFIDRLRVDPPRLAYLVALGSAYGLESETPWINGYGAVDKIFVSDSNGDGRDDFEAEWNDGQFRCVIWSSTGSAFTRANCPQ
ncbi:FG-GAP repeat domain-containing protein [Sphingobium naphthae]|uniref:VCBS repeat-containing protein n=1 Tax=Sphingobium naphthae TaxID=1886786 RepID=A0ABU3ZUG8_9SPHN|nr:VCBS repeat-containing protein [Sphingobium naphthae]MDV5823108.1 VCBS repeat-containing protein [Sphingobium naphthae]